MSADVGFTNPLKISPTPGLNVPLINVKLIPE